MSDIELAPEAFVRRLFEDGWNRGSFDFLSGATAPVVPFHYNGLSMEVTPESLPPLVDTWRQAFPDLEMKIRHLVASEDLVAVSLTFHGTHQGEWWGIPPSGQAVSIEETMFFRFDRGVLVEMWELFDEHTLRSQIETNR